MKKYLNTIDAFILQCHWQDLALIKVATAAVGVLLGLMIPRRTRKFAAITAAIVAVGAAVPMVLKLLRMFGLFEDEQELFDD